VRVSSSTRATSRRVRTISSSRDSPSNPDTRRSQHTRPGHARHPTSVSRSATLTQSHAVRRPQPNENGLNVYVEDGQVATNDFDVLIDTGNGGQLVWAVEIDWAELRLQDDLLPATCGWTRIPGPNGIGGWSGPWSAAWPVSAWSPS
jgi:hypothetical protein